MIDIGSYSYVYVVMDPEGDPVLVTMTAGEAEDFIFKYPSRSDYYIEEVPFKHHN
jgi:hypothetical protein